MISLADLLKLKEKSNASHQTLENIYLALIKFDSSSSSTTTTLGPAPKNGDGPLTASNNINNNNNYATTTTTRSSLSLITTNNILMSRSTTTSSSAAENLLKNSEYIILKDASALGSGGDAQKESIIIQTLRLICQRQSCNWKTSSTSGTHTGPYAYIPGLIGSQNDQFSSKYAAYAELALLILIFSIWIFSIMLCFNRYSKLRTLQPMLQPYNRGPMHIEDSNPIHISI
jgi:hypothetical protein